MNNKPANTEKEEQPNKSEFEKSIEKVLNFNLKKHKKSKKEKEG